MIPSVTEMEQVRADFAFAARALRRSPGFTLAAALTLAVGIAAATTVFSVVNAVLLRPLPYRDPGRLVLVLRDSPGGNLGTGNLLYSNADFSDLSRGTSGIFDDMGGVASFRAFAPRQDGALEQLSNALVTPNLFRLLGVRIVLGRDFSDDDARPSASQSALIPIGTAAILSNEYWQRRYGGDSSVLGRPISGSREDGPRIVGVLEPGFRLYLPPDTRVDAVPDFYVANNGGYDAAHRNLLLVGAIARLRTGVSVELAQQRIQSMAPALLRTTFDPKASLRLEAIRRYLVRDVRPAIVAMMGSVIFLLLIACANVSSLLLIRTGRRERDLAVRAALGGSAWRLVRQMLAEAVLLAAAGTVVGIALAWAGVRVFLRLAPANLPRVESTSIDWRVLAFAAVSGLAAAALFGIPPAWRAARPNLSEILRSAGRGMGLVSGGLLRNAVVVAEVSLSFVLLIGSSLMFRSFLELQRVNPGFQPHGVLTFFVTRDWPLGRQDGRLELLREIQSRLRAIPGVQDVTAGLFLPLTRGPRADQPAPAPPRQPETPTSAGADFQHVLPGYFETLHTPLLEGRTFTELDNTPGRNVVVIDQTLAAIAFPKGSPVGKRIAVPFPDMPWAEVVGVVSPQRSFSLAQPGTPAIYFPEGAVGIGVSRTWAIRATGDPASYAAAVRSVLARIDPSLVPTRFQPMDTLVTNDQSRTRFSLLLLGFFAVVAVLLAAVGIYSVLASAVRQRTMEIGIRMALGASPAGIFEMIVARGLGLAAAGVALGLAASFELTQFLAGMLVGIRPTDPATFAAVTALFLLIAALACWLPARRAALLDPSEALRSE
jgi:putative ABC transport system permease protein